MKMFLRLFHGRDNPGDQPDGWGFDGPIIGPLQWVHTTYGSHVRGAFLEGDSGDGDAFDITLVDDCFPWEGKLYGDWSVYVQP